MKFAVAFVAFLACASASYAPYYAAPAYPAYAGAYAHYPAADIKVLPSGFLADTPEVAHAKAAHEVAKGYVAAAAAASPDYDSYYQGYAAPRYYAAPSAGPYAYDYATPYAGYAPYKGSYYSGPLADIKVLPNGFVADTPEVAYAKASHEVAKG
uniref:Cuticle protein n=1 Tax=Cacopsylla melanoneura TaxID=428564 RepID=A0A8D8M497_9HEMI